MKRTFGITILTLMAGFSIMLSGCGSSSGQGLGLLQPYETGTPGGGGGGVHPPSPSPSVSPTPSPTPATDVVLSSLTNPANMYSAEMDVWAIVGFGLQDHDANKIIRFSQDTNKNVSKKDPKTPQEFTLNIEDGANYLTNCSWLTGTIGVDASGKDQLYLLVADGFNTSNGRILLLTPEKDSKGNWKSEIKGKQLVPDDAQGGASISPFCVCADGQFIWWTEHTSNGSVYRADLTQDPIKVEQFMSGMNYPAGISSNGGFVAIADTGNNRIIIANCDQDNANLPVPIQSGKRVQIAYAQPTSGTDTLRHPFEIKWLANNHFIATDGMGLGMNGAPAPSGSGQGHLWLWEGPTSDEFIGNPNLIQVASGFTNPSGLQVLYDASADANRKRVDVAFVESNETINQGSLRFYSFSTKNYEKLVSSRDEYLEESLNMPYQTENIVGTVTSISAAEGGEVLVHDPPEYIILMYTEGFKQGLNEGDIKRYTSIYPEIK